jgi:hypothetical protein
MIIKLVFLLGEQALFPNADVGLNYTDGRRIVKQVHSPGLLFTDTVPFRRSNISFTITSPKPLPSSTYTFAFSVLKNSEKR